MKSMLFHMPMSESSFFSGAPKWLKCYKRTRNSPISLKSQGKFIKMVNSWFSENSNNVHVVETNFTLNKIISIFPLRGEHYI